MTKKCIILADILKADLREGGMQMEEERPATLVNLPTSVRGFCYHDDDGEAYVVLNARLTRETNRQTWCHEQDHIKRGDMYNVNYREYKEGSA